MSVLRGGWFHRLVWDLRSVCWCANVLCVCYAGNVVLAPDVFVYFLAYLVAFVAVVEIFSLGIWMVRTY